MKEKTKLIEPHNGCCFTSIANLHGLAVQNRMSLTVLLWRHMAANRVNHVHSASPFSFAVNSKTALSTLFGTFRANYDGDNTKRPHKRPHQQDGEVTHTLGGVSSKGVTLNLGPASDLPSGFYRAPR